MTTNPQDESRIRALVEAVERADLAGDRASAESALAQARKEAPDHAGVLNVAGMRALQAGDADSARRLLQRATASDPSSPTLWLNLALAHRGVKDEGAEREAVERSLALEPRYYLALLQKARLLERQGKLKQAAPMYFAFTCCLPPGPMVPAVQAAVAHAQKVMAANNAALEAAISGPLDEARARHSGEKLDRFDACLGMILGKRAAYAPQPTFMQFPRIPAIEFLDREGFPWLDEFEASAREIRDEAAAAFAVAGSEFVPYISKPEGTPVDQWRELNQSTRWSSYFLLKNGQHVEDHLARCPRTAALLQAAPLCEVHGHAPTAFFSVLAPRTRIPAHTGVSNTRFIVHLPLVAPPGCGFRVGAETRAFREGRAWVFDDTFEHEAWNDSDEPRIILIFDIWNTFLSAAERDLVDAVTRSIQEFYEGESPFRQGG